MDLWIRTQDRKGLVKVNAIFIDDTNMIDNGYVTIYSQCCEYELGTYPTKERALEVLDEIQKFISQEDYLHIRKSSLNNLDDIEEPKYILKSCGIPKVYEMPKE